MCRKVNAFPQNCCQNEGVFSQARWYGGVLFLLHKKREDEHGFVELCTQGFCILNRAGQPHALSFSMILRDVQAINQERPREDRRIKEDLKILDVVDRLSNGDRGWEHFVWPFRWSRDV